MLTPITGAPTLTVPSLSACEMLAAIWVNSVCCEDESVEADVDVARLCPGVVINDSTMTDPFLTPTIFSLPGSMPRNAQILVINVVGPLLLKKSITGILNLAVSLT